MAGLCLKIQSCTSNWALFIWTRNTFQNLTSSDLNVFWMQTGNTRLPRYWNHLAWEEVGILKKLMEIFKSQRKLFGNIPGPHGIANCTCVPAPEFHDWASPWRFRFSLNKFIKFSIEEMPSLHRNPGMVSTPDPFKVLEKTSFNSDFTISSAFSICAMTSQYWIREKQNWNEMIKSI